MGPVSAVMKIDEESTRVVSNIKRLKTGKQMRPFEDKLPPPPTLKIGHLYAWIQYEKLPPGPCLKCCGFPCCCCICCMGHPFALGWCYADPAGKATADFMKAMILHK